MTVRKIWRRNCDDNEKQQTWQTCQRQRNVAKIAEWRAAVEYCPPIQRYLNWQLLVNDESKELHSRSANDWRNETQDDWEATRTFGSKFSSQYLRSYAVDLLMRPYHPNGRTFLYLWWLFFGPGVSLALQMHWSVWDSINTTHDSYRRTSSRSEVFLAIRSLKLVGQKSCFVRSWFAASPFECTCYLF